MFLLVYLPNYLNSFDGKQKPNFDTSYLTFYVIFCEIFYGKPNEGYLRQFDRNFYTFIEINFCVVLIKIKNALILFLFWKYNFALKTDNFIIRIYYKVTFNINNTLIIPNIDWENEKNGLCIYFTFTENYCFSHNKEIIK